MLLLAVLAAGRLVRHQMLMGPEGLPLTELWLDDLLAASRPQGTGSRTAPEKPRLTTPLPVNICSIDSLTLLPGVGPVLATRLAAARSNGLVFRSKADLQRIKGIGPVLAGRLAPHVIFASSEVSDSSATRPGS